jgi:hypothetical protein
MKKSAIQIAAVVGFALLLIAPGDGFGTVGGLAWSVVLSLAFAVISSLFVDASAFFVVSVVALLTVAFPLVVLIAIAYPVYLSLSKSVAVLAANLSAQPLRSVLLFAAPTAAVAGAMRLIKHREEKHHHAPGP